MITSLSSSLIGRTTEPMSAIRLIKVWLGVKEGSV
jgi:hypothetical protein